MLKDLEELASKFEDCYIPTLLLAQFYYNLQKIEKAKEIAEISLKNYSKTGFYGEEEAIKIKEQLRKSTHGYFGDFNEHWESFSKKLENRTQLLTEDFSGTLGHGVDSLVSRTKNLFSSKQTRFSDGEDFYCHIALVFYDSKDYKKAKELFDKAIEAAKSGKRRSLGWLYFNQSLNSFFLKDFDDVLKLGKEASYHAVPFENVHVLNALAYKHLKNEDLSKSELEKAIKLKDTSQSYFDQLEKEFQNQNN